MKNLVKEKMQRGEKALGTFFELGGSTAAECMGLTGLDFLIIDTEHGPFDVESAMNFTRVSELRGIAPFVRVKDTTRPSILKMLDIGAMGLIIPCVQTIDEVRRIVEYGKYYPLGQRGFAPARKSGFGFEPFAQDIGEYFETCNRETLLIPQCETRGCLEDIEAIAATPGVDGIFVGPYDLSVALEKPARFNDPEIIAAIARILAACKAAGKFSFIYAGNKENVKKHLADGFDGVAYSMDAIVYVEAYRAFVQEIRTSQSESGS